jgi:hypothetical protein
MVAFEPVKEGRMRIPGLTVFSALIIVAVFLAWPLGASAQPVRQDPYQVLEESSRAMMTVQSARFSGGVDMHGPPSAGMPSNMAISVSGEYVAPDSMRMTMDLGSLLGALLGSSSGSTMEMVVIGDTAWARMGSTPWETMNMGIAPGTMTMTPVDMNRQIQAMARYMPNAVLDDRGSEWEVRGDIDMVGALEEGLAMSSMMGMGMPGGGMPAFDQGELAMFGDMTARFSTRINKSTFFMEHMQISVEMPEPGGSGSLRIVVDLGFSDFNSPGINIQPPM